MDINELRSTVGNQAEFRLEEALFQTRQLKYIYSNASVDLDGIRGDLRATLDLFDNLELLEKRFLVLEAEAKMLLDIKDPAITESVTKPAPSIVPDDIAF